MAKRLTTKTIEERQLIKERLAMYYTQHLHISGYMFSRNMGLEASYIKTFTGNPKDDVRALFKATYPAFNLDWALTGKGNMINEGWKDRESTIFPQPGSKNKKIRDREQKEQVEIFEVQSNDMHSMIEMLKVQLEKKDSMIEKLWEKLHDLSDKLDKAQKELNK